MSPFPWIVSVALATPAAAPPPPVTALAYRPDGGQLAAAVHREVVLVNVADGSVAARMESLPGRATAVAFSRDGARLAVACGGSGQPNEVRLYATSTASAPARTLTAAHADVIYDLAFSPDGKRLATAGYDRLVKVWELTSAAAPPLVLKDHSDAVYGVAFSPDGKLLASAAADRAVKVWDLATGHRLY